MTSTALPQDSGEGIRNCFDIEVSGATTRVPLRNINPFRRFPAKPASSVEPYFRKMAQLIPALPYQAIDQIAAAFLEALQEGRRVFVFGNGGSAASASRGNSLRKSLFRKCRHQGLGEVTPFIRHFT